MLPSDNQEFRREFQKSIDPNESRKKRLDDRLSLRKKNRQERLNKRRKKNTFVSSFSNNKNNNKRSEIPPWVTVSNLQKFVSMINTNNFDDILKGVRAIRQLLSVEDQPPIEEVFKSNVVPKLLNIMEKEIPKNHNNQEKLKKLVTLQFEAAWAVTNIASGDPKFTIHLVKMSAIRSFMKLLRNTRDAETADQAIWGLGNIAGDCPRLRDEVLNTGVLKWILTNLMDFPISMKRNAVWTISNFCRGKPSPDWEKVKHILPPLSKLIVDTKDYDIIVDILWTVSFLSEDRSANGSNQQQQIYRSYYNSNTPYSNNINVQDEEQRYGASFQVKAVLSTNILQYVIHLVDHASKMGRSAFDKIQNIREQGRRANTTIPIPNQLQQQLSTSDFVIAPCVRILGNIVSGTDEQTQRVVDDGFYDIIEVCIDHRVRNIRKEACWALSNVVAGTQNQLDKFFESKTLVEKVVNLALHGEINVRKEAGWCLSNAICGASFDQVEKLVECRFIEAMVGLLDLHNIEKILRMAMEALDGCMMSYVKHAKKHNMDPNYNPFAQKVEELKGLDKLEDIQTLNNVSNETYKQAADIIEKHWNNTENNNNDNDMFENNDFNTTNNNDNDDDDMWNSNQYTNDDNNSNNNNIWGDDNTSNVNDSNVYEF